MLACRRLALLLPARSCAQPWPPPQLAHRFQPAQPWPPPWLRCSPGFRSLPRSSLCSRAGKTSVPPAPCGSRQLPTLPSRSQLSTISVWRLNFCVRYGYRWCPPAIVTGNFPGGAFPLPVRFASLFASASRSFRSVRSPLPAPSKLHRSELTSKLTLSFVFLGSSPRPISIGKLHASQRFHRRPIYLIVSEGSYLL